MTMSRTIESLAAAANVIRNSQSVTVAELRNAVGEWQTALTSLDVQHLLTQVSLDPQSLVAVLQLPNQPVATYETICSLLSVLLSTESLISLLTAHESLLLMGIGSKMKCVQGVAVGLLRRKTQSAESITSLIHSPVCSALLNAFVTSQSISDLLLDIASPPWALELLLSTNGDLLSFHMAHKDVAVKLRAYELVAKLCLASPDTFRICQSHGLLDVFQKDLDSNDILETMNMVELYTQIAETPTGCLFLDHLNVLSRLADLFRNVSPEVDDITEVLLLCSVIKFWGILLCHQSDSITPIDAKYNILGGMTPFLNDSRSEIKDAIRVAIGNIGSSSPGLILLYNQRNLLQSMLDNRKCISGDDKISFLKTTACLFNVGNEENKTAVEAVKYIYDQLGGKSFVKELMKDATSILEEISVVAHSILNGILSYAWGIQQLLIVPELSKFVLQRQARSSTLVKEWKFSLVVTILRHAVTPTILDEAYIKSLNKYKSQGAFYIEESPMIAMESA